MGPLDPEPLAASARAYAEALQQAADSSGHGGAVTLEAVEDVLQARLGLYRCLIAIGWVPPPRVATAIRLDDQLLHEPSHEGRVERDGWPAADGP